MTSALTVHMDGVVCGTLLQSDQGSLSFRYDEGYRTAPGATPLSLSMPLALVEHRNAAVRPFFDGLITDNVSARRAIAARYGVSAANPFALLEHIGADVAGALQVLPEGEMSRDRDLGRGHQRLLDDVEVEALLRQVLEEYEQGVPTGAVGRFSLAGAQPKTALVRTSDGAWAQPVGGTASTHILKPVAGRFRRVDVVEHMTMRAAAVLGLEVASTELRTFGDVRTFVTRRYDRVHVDGVVRRLHQEDLGQALRTPPAKKYQREDGGPGVAEISALFRGLPRAVDRAPAAASFFEALMFNVALECTDAHVKNYSVLLHANEVRLAPLYDLATYALYRSDSATTYSAMKVGGEYRFAAIGMQQCLSAAKTLRVDEERAVEIVNRIRSGAVGAFEVARDELDDQDESTAEVARTLVDRVAELPNLG